MLGSSKKEEEAAAQKIKERRAEAYKKISADDLAQFDDVSNPLTKKTEAEKKADIEKTKSRTGYTTILLRQGKINKDIAILALIISLFCYASHSVGQMEKFSFSAIVEVVVAMVGGVLAVVWKLHTPPGKLTKKLAARANKSEDDLDDWGNTIDNSRR